MMRGLRLALVAVLAIGAVSLAQALWIPAKAVLAQGLLWSAWRKVEAGETGARPWPWADTAPVAVLEAPGLGLRQVVLEGSSGRNLAFGPTAMSAVTAPDVVMSGHRDTHFAFLAKLRVGDPLALRVPGGVRRFRVDRFEVVDSRRARLVIGGQAERLTLITCYPLDAETAGGPLRLVVTAGAVET